MRCDDGCGACCGVVPAGYDEYNAIIEYALAHGIKPIAQGVTCPFYQEGKCTVYPVRPTMCHVFGHVKEMPCVKGYNVNVDPKIVRKAVEESGKDSAVLLHEALVDFGIVKSTSEVLGDLTSLLEAAMAAQRALNR